MIYSTADFLVAICINEKRIVPSSRSGIHESGRGPGFLKNRTEPLGPGPIGPWIPDRDEIRLLS